MTIETIQQPTKRRSAVWLALAGVASVASLTIGATLALFSATETSSSNSFSAGTVSVGLGAASTTCNIVEMMPGDSSTQYSAGPIVNAVQVNGSQNKLRCTYNVKYTGSADAYLAVDFALANGSTALYTGSENGLQIVLKDATRTYVSNTSFTSLAGTSTTVAAGTPVTNLLINDVPASTDTLVSFTVDYSLPIGAPNLLQGGSASVVLTFHAVQAVNQSLGTCVAGRQCNTLNWS